MTFSSLKNNYTFLFIFIFQIACQQKNNQYLYIQNLLTVSKSDLKSNVLVFTTNSCKSCQITLFSSFETNSIPDGFVILVPNGDIYDEYTEKIFPKSSIIRYSSIEFNEVAKSWYAGGLLKYKNNEYYMQNVNPSNLEKIHFEIFGY